jgi:Cu/Ag efflux protein CusF
MKNAIAAGLILAVAACPGPRMLDVKGKVIAVDTAAKTLELNQAAIPGNMEAMVMKYPLGDVPLPEGLKVGDSVQVTVRMGTRSFVITGLKKL